MIQETISLVPFRLEIVNLSKKHVTSKGTVNSIGGVEANGSR